jgi:uncharacterized protein
MKQFSTFLNAVLAGVLTFILLFSVFPIVKANAAQTSQPTAVAPQSACDSSRTIQVSGTAVVNVTPDRVLIQIGVQSNGFSVQEVQRANTATIGDVVNAIKALGIDAKDIATDWYVINPIYEDYDALRIKGYRINNSVAITLREISRANDVITAALGAGANQVMNVEFYTSQLRTYRDQARILAVQAATEKAQALTGAAGAGTGCLLNISENTWSYYNGGWYGSNQNLWTQNTMQNAAPASGGGTLTEAGPVNLGQIAVRAEVSITFGLK